jgi:anti-anti-sigma factor
MLKYNIEKTTPVTLISLQGRFDSSGAATFEEKFQTNYSLFPVLNFSEVTYLSSAGIRVLLQSEKSLRKQNSKLILSEVASTIKQVLEITGLLQQFTILDSNTEAINLALRLQGSVKNQFRVTKDNVVYTVQPFDTTPGRADIWQPGKMDKDYLMAVNLNEFKFAVGTGGLGTTREEAKELLGEMIITKNFIGLIPESGAPDYLFSKNPSDTFFFIKSAVNFSDKPNILIKTAGNDQLTIKELIANSSCIVSDSFEKPLPAAGFLLIANIHGTNSRLFSIGVMGDKLNGKIPDGVMADDSDPGDDNTRYKSIGIVIKGQDCSNDDVEECVNSILQEDNISELVFPAEELKISAAKLWMFIPDFHYTRESRLKIEYDNPDMPDEFEIITRNIYSDCSSIRLHQLHGGFSAKTFQVYGYDKKGIRILPTVLKLAKRSTIRREVTNYEDNVKRYILNNSTSVMGSFYYGRYGGVRYNFVGITGPDSKISWLTNYYKENLQKNLYHYSTGFLLIYCVPGTDSRDLKLFIPI